jgi:crossover junction endodeoxyribonuclease RuvC
VIRRVLGIDPGSRITGFGLIEADGPRTRYLGSGVIRTGSGDFPSRLRTIFEDLRSLISAERAEEVVIEQVYVRSNAASALKLGQARGAAICAAASAGLPVYEYTATMAKLALVGHGRASKAEVQEMVKRVLNLQGIPSEDAADALAMALCHIQQGGLRGLMAGRS